MPLSLIDYLEDESFQAMFDTVMLRSVMSIPSACRGRENRMLMDYGIRRAFVEELGGDLFESPLHKCWDLVFNLTEDKISLKKQDIIFPRKKLIGTGFTAPKPLMIKNCMPEGRTTSNKLHCTYDLLLAVQPPSENNAFIVAVMRAHKIPKLATRAKSGDQWLLAPRIKDWDHYREIDCSVSGVNFEKYNLKLFNNINNVFADSYHDKDLKVAIL